MRKFSLFVFGFVLAVSLSTALPGVARADTVNRIGFDIWTCDVAGTAPSVTYTPNADWPWIVMTGFYSTSGTIEYYLDGASIALSDVGGAVTITGSSGDHGGKPLFVIVGDVIKYQETADSYIWNVSFNYGQLSPLLTYFDLVAGTYSGSIIYYTTGTMALSLDGDIAAPPPGEAPIPAAALLFAPGFLGLICFRKRIGRR